MFGRRGPHGEADEQDEPTPRDDAIDYDCSEAQERIRKRKADHDALLRLSQEIMKSLADYARHLKYERVRER